MRPRHRRTISRAYGSLLEAGNIPVKVGQSRPSIQKPSSLVPRMMVSHPRLTSAPSRREASNACAPEKRADARVRAEC